MKSNILHRYQWSPFRTPVWRWVAANQLCMQGAKSSSRIDDPWVSRAMAHLTFAKGKEKGQANGRPALPDQEIIGALKLLQEEPRRRRMELEALLLTTESLTEIAQRFQLPIQTLACFHDLFFDVRPYLHARDWIVLRAIGTGYAEGSVSMPRESIWKMAAYCGGPRALDIIVAVTMNEPLPEWLRPMLAERPAYEETRIRLLAKLAVAAWKADSPELLKGLLKIQRQLLRLDQSPSTCESSNILPLQEAFLKLSAHKLGAGVSTRLNASSGEANANSSNTHASESLPCFSSETT